MSISIAYLALAILVNCASNLIFKAASFASGAGRIVRIALGLALGTFYVLIYSKSLERIKLSIAYPTLACGSLIIITLVSAFLFRETISIKAAAGMALAIGGISLIAI